MSEWPTFPIKDLTTKVGSGATPRGGEASYKESGTPLIRSLNVHFNGFRYEGLAFLDESQAEQLKSVEVRKDDVLLNITGASIGRVTQAPPDLDGARVSQHVCIIRPVEVLHPAFLRWYLASPSQQSLIIREQTGATRQGLTKEKILNFSVPVPSLSEQRRIVSKIEELFSDLDAGVAALERAKANLKRYRAAVLKAAVEGKLTEAWRAEHPNTEPATKLLERILAERRKKWEADQLAKFVAAKKEPPKNWKEKYVEPSPPYTSGLPELPEGWCWASLDSLCCLIADIDHNMPKSVEAGIKFLSAKDLLDDGTLNFTKDVKLISETDYLRLSRKAKPQRNDIIYSRIGARLGKSRLVETDERFLVSYSCCTIRPLILRPRFLARYLDCGFVLRRALSDAQSIGVPDLGLEKIKAFAVPLCSLEEQDVIVGEMEEKLSVIAGAENEVEHSILRAARLRQSILKQAFEGKLVPQDPTDEPASVLLERLREGRTDANGTASVRKRRAKA